MDINRLRELAGIPIMENDFSFSPILDKTESVIINAISKYAAILALQSYLEMINDGEDVSFELIKDPHFFMDLLDNILDQNKTQIERQVSQLLDDPFPILFGKNPNKEKVIKTLLQIYKTTPDAPVTKSLIASARRHGHNYPEFETIEKSFNQQK